MQSKGKSLVEMFGLTLKDTICHIAIRLEAIASRLEAIASRSEAIAIRLEAIAVSLKAFLI